MFNRGEIIKTKTLLISLIMLSLVMLSAGVAFASDDIANTVAADEIAVDDSLAVEQDTQAVSDDNSDSKIVITPENIGNYIEESGKIKENVTADELVFDGDFNSLNVTVERPMTLTGGEVSSFKNPNIQIYASNVTLQKFIINQDKGVNSIFVGPIDDNTTTSDVSISDVAITFFDDQNGAGAVPIEVVKSDNFVLKDSYIAYSGKTDGYYINNAIRVASSRNAKIYNNRIHAELISVPVGWSEEPAGSGQWVSSPVSEAVVIKYSENATFDNNIVTVLCTNASGSYDTIYAVDVSGSGAIVTNNNITANGNTYIYGLILSGDDFIIRANDIKSTGVYYANGIDIEGPATGVVGDNNINVESESSAYGIYSGMNGQNVSASYSGNNISGTAYNAFGMSVGDVNANVSNSFIDLTGNYTTGLAYRGTLLFLNDNNIVLTSSEVGNESIWEGFGVEAVGVKIIKGTGYLTNNTIATQGKGVSLTTNETSAYIDENFINVVANDDKDAYAIYAVDASSVIVVNNTIDYQGATKGSGINRAVYVKNLTGTIFTENTFDLDLVSSYVPWAEIPAGSGNWVSSPVSEGIVIEDSDGAIFGENVVNATFGDVVGSYDTIYVVDVKGSDNAHIISNDIKAKGNTYIYGIIASGNNLHITDNSIFSEGNYYANGIDIEGPATAVVEDNFISASANSSAYAIYSGMNGQEVSANYTNNTIMGDAYNVFGMSIGDTVANVAGGRMDLIGNYTTGIAYRGSNLTVSDVVILFVASNKGNESIWEEFGVETIGVKVVKGNAQITNNHIVGTGNYTVDVKDTKSSVHDNYLKAETLFGDASVNNMSADAEIYNNTPIASTGIINIIEVDGNGTIIASLTDTKGTPVPWAFVSYSFNDTTVFAITEDDGTFKLENLSNGKIDISFDGNFHLAPYKTSITLKDVAPVAPVKVTSAFNITDRAITINGYAVDGPAGEQGIYYATELLDENGNPIQNVYIEFAVNNKIYNRTTYENGSFAPYKLNMVRAGRYTMAFNFAGDDNYTNAFACVCVDLDKKPITIKASSKSYKAATKTKKYTVTLSTIKGLDGKMYLSPKAVSLKVNGKTYTVKTNSKGVATFKITNLTKKAKYSAVISYDGDKTYESASKKVTITVK